MYLSWAAYYEGNTDDQYYRVLIPRLLDELVRAHNGRLPITIADYPALRVGERDRSREVVASEMCEGRGAFDLFFVHADTGGRGLQGSLGERCQAFIDAAVELCDFDADAAVRMCPKLETESWALADGDAVCAALGFNGTAADLGIPTSARDIERLPDPKATLTRALSEASRRRKLKSNRLLPLIAQTQRLDRLRRLSSFRQFETDVLSALGKGGFLR